MELFHQNCALIGYYAASSGNFLPTFRDNLSVPFSGLKNPKSRILKVAPIGCYEMSVRNSCYSLIGGKPEKRSSQLRSGGSLKTRRLLPVCCPYQSKD
jgi:hypothetical protein